MQLYEIHTLADSNHPDPYGYPGYLKCPPVNSINFSKVNSDSDLGYYLKHLNLESLRFKVNKTSTFEGATIKLILNFKKKTNKEEFIYVLGSIKLSAINHNCGSVHISNLNSMIPNLGIGKLLLEEVENWCRTVGYTMLFGNTAGSQNKYALPFFEKFGYKRMGEPYKNVRSGNTNIWFFKLIQEQPKEIDLQENEDDDEDEF